ncbi:TlpA family protein disulfide reductase [Alteromonadaceae bacterium M269]|nr:TlpA family protein disulfide reductase [Alteromonadaceae bacterium M269]
MFKKLLPAITALVSLVVGVFVFLSLQYDFKTLDGNKWRMEDQKGQWIIINHFAEWCAPCLEEVPELNKLDEQLKGTGMQLFAVSYDEMPTQALVDIRERYDMQFKLVEQKYAAKLPGSKPKQLPATYLISPNGQHVETVLGKQTAESLLSAVSRAKMSTN